jgi:hypothetical protein
MIATYLILKIAMQAIMEECNRMAVLAESQASTSYLKERIANLEMAFASGSIDAATYEKGAMEIMDELGKLSRGGLQAGGIEDEL